MRAVAFLLALCSIDAAYALKAGHTSMPNLARFRGGAVTSTVKTPGETYMALAEKGAANAKTPLPKALHQAFMGGMYVAIGGIFALVVAGALPHLGPDLQRLVVGAIFPVGLIFILQAAGQRAQQLARC